MTRVRSILTKIKMLTLTCVLRVLIKKLKLRRNIFIKICKIILSIIVYIIL